MRRIGKSQAHNDVSPDVAATTGDTGCNAGARPGGRVDQPPTSERSLRPMRPSSDGALASAGAGSRTDGTDWRIAGTAEGLACSPAAGATAPSTGLPLR